MSTAKSLQKPQILGMLASTIRIKHPDISHYPRTYIRSEFSAGATALTVGDNDGFADDDWFILGEIGDNTTEEDDVNGAVTRGSALTITNTTKFSHGLDTPVTRIQERKIALYGAASDGGSLTSIYSAGTSKNIRWDKLYTEITLITTDTAYAYYVVKFYDGTTESAASDYLPSTGLAKGTVGHAIERALDLTNCKIDPENITWEFLIRSADACQDAITQFSYTNTRGDLIRKDWSFEIVEDVSSLTALTLEDKYALSSLTSAPKYVDTKQAIMSVRLGSHPLEFITPQDLDIIRENTIRGELSSAVAAAATSITLKNSSEFASSGNFQIGAETVAYTANSTSTGVLSGISASAITGTYSADRAVWQGVSGGLPTHYTIFDGKLIFNIPISSTYANFRIQIRYLYKLSALTETTDTSAVTFPTVFSDWIASDIEWRKQRPERAKEFRGKWQEAVLMNALGEQTPTMDTYSYYEFSDGDNLHDFPIGVRFPNLDT